MFVAVHYSSIHLPTASDGRIYGLQVAIADWLKAWFTYARARQFVFLIGNRQEKDELLQIAQAAGIDPKRLAMLDRRFPDQNYAQFTTVMRLEPNTQNLLWQRQLGGKYTYCGLAHAISGVEAGEALQEFCLSPSEATDAIVCPSRAVQSAIRAFWSHYGDFIQQRFGAAYQCPVQLPVIPLGLDIEKFERRATADKRAAQRAALGIGENDIVLLWVGRFSAAIKAHPLAMFQAAELAAQKTGAKLHLVMVGYFIPAEGEAAFKKMAADTCATASVTFIATNDARFPDGLWAAGDIFLSLIDNMQESFGLTPVEAMAAGLPRVISDWNGYRDSVTDGEDGFLIRTTQPPAGNGFDLTAQVMNGHESYGGFLAKAALTVSIDVDQAADRIALLIQDKNLRARMAAKARARVEAVYGWQHIIPAYENLWGELAERRAASPPPSQRMKSALPLLPDPYTMYQTYPASVMQEADRIALAATPEQIKQIWQQEVNIYAHDLFLSPADVTAVMAWLAGAGETTIGLVFAQFSALDKPRLWRFLAWLLKFGIIKKLSSKESLKA